MKWLLTLVCVVAWSPSIAGLRPLWSRNLSVGGVEISASYLVATYPDEVIVLTLDKGEEVLRILGHCRVNVQDKTAIATRPSITWDGPGSTEGWSLTTKKLLWTVHTAARPIAGQLNDGRLIYVDAEGINEVEIPSGKKIRSRAIKTSYGSLGRVFVTPERILFALGHEVYGLETANFDRGWRCYVDVGVDIVDAYGMYGFGSLSHDVVAIDLSGNVRWHLNGRGTSYNYATTRPALMDGIIAVGGARVTNSLQYVSGYLFALDAVSGKHLWKRPMDALRVQSFAGGFAVVAAHPRGKQMSQALEVYEPKTGRLLDRRPVRGQDWYPHLAAEGQYVAYGDGEKLTVYRWTGK